LAKWKAWYTTERGFEIFIEVEAETYDEARHKAELKAPKGSEYRYILKID